MYAYCIDIILISHKDRMAYTLTSDHSDHTDNREERYSICDLESVMLIVM